MLVGMSQASSRFDESRGTAFNGPPDVRLHIGRKREGRDLFARWVARVERASTAGKHPKDVLHWYDRWKAKPKTSPHSFGWSGPGAYADRVAAAVVSSHPQRSAEIYRAQIDRLLPQTGASAYEAVASYLRQLKPVLKSIDRESEWTQLIQEIRERYRNRPRFMEVLDRLESRPIVSRHKGGG